MRLLCTGDLHIGRRSAGAQGKEFSCGEAWVRLARLAAGDDVDGIRIPKVDVVLISGDLTDEHNRYYQAAGPVERGLALLHDAGIPTIAVAGNHDSGTLADLYRAFENHYRFHVLGLGGRWETHLHDDRLKIHGWSYPKSEYPACPLRERTPSPDDLPAVGLVHVQATAGGDAYAFARPQDFLAHPDVDLWVTGHLHAPTYTEHAGRVLNPGSPQAMDPGEPGWHGAYVVSLGAKGQIGAPEPVPVSTAWYQTVPVYLGPDGEDDADRLRYALHAAIVAQTEQVRLRNPLCRRLSLRIDIEGRTQLSRAALDAEAKALKDNPDLGLGGPELVIERVTFDRVRPPLDLTRLATELGPTGILARALLDLETATPDFLAQAAQNIAAHPFFAAAKEVAPMDDTRIRAAARDHGYRMLEALEAQRAAWEARS